MSQAEIIQHLRSGADELEKRAMIELEAAKKMRQQAMELESMDGMPKSLPDEAAIVLPKPATKARKTPGRKGGKKLDRLAELSKFIKEHQPVSRKKIYEESGLPHGTLNTKLNLANFHQDENSLWRLKPMGTEPTKS